MSKEVRSRGKASSPPPGNLPSQYQSAQPRFPARPHDRLDADERKAHAKSGSLKHSQRAFGGLRLTSMEWRLLLGITFLALFVRLRRLSWPSSVVFDEVHFGKFAGKYLQTRYYVDVHPPLAKLLITLMALIGGFDGHSFDFTGIGTLYPKNVPYVLMRSLPALLGVAVVPLSYLTLRGFQCNATTAVLGSLFITFENGLITQSRLILLDSPLIFFTALSLFFWVGFSNENHQEPFTEDWWIWLTCTGLSIGAVASCKWVGLFTIATIGLGTIKQLWDLLGDLRVSPRLWIKHFFARALCLIVLPITVYMAVFEIHFLVLQNSGDGDGFMSAQFQHTLHGKGMKDTWADVAMGSTVSLRHVNTQGGYLHSHDHNYPTGSKQQQITLYPHRDGNNDWVITHANDGQPDHDYATEPLLYLKTGMTIRLEHLATSKRLHSHDVRAPVSEVDFQNEVSGYGYPGFAGDANDNWIVEIEHGDGSDWHSSKRVRTLRTVFRLRHALQGCYLFSHKVKLPEWAYEQQEVTCNKNAAKPNSLWYFETNSHPQLGEDAEKVNYRNPGFFGKFWELQKVMWTTNAGLTDRHAFDSRPHTWPILRRGINFWVRDHRQIYLLGNPVIWWLSTVSVVLYLAARAFLILRAKRQYKDFNNSTILKYDQICGFLTLGWFVHYFPFFIMQRQLFLHHYFPALYYSILLFCSIFDFGTSQLGRRTRFQVAMAFIFAAVAIWWHFSPLVYAGEWTKSQCESSKWLKSWDFSCDNFPVQYSDYADFPHVSGLTTDTPSATQPHPDGAAAGGQPQNVAKQVAEAVKAAVGTTDVGKQVEPGRNVFEVKDKAPVQSSKKNDFAPIIGPAAPESVSKHAETAEQSAQAVQPPPPLPPNELGDLSTAEVNAPVEEAQEQPPAAVPELETTSEVVADAPAETSSESTAEPQSTSSKSLNAADQALEDEAEKVRKELFPEGK